MKLPSSIDAERTLLSGILLYGQKHLSDAAMLLTGADFYHPAHKAIFEAFVELDQQRAAIDVVSVVEKLKARGTFEQLGSVGGKQYLDELLRELGGIGPPLQYAKIVAGKANSRAWLIAAAELLQSYTDDDDEFAQIAERRFSEVTKRVRHFGQIETMKMQLEAVRKSLHERYEARKRGQVFTGVVTGFSSLDVLTGGLQPSELIILAARPAMGKSALAGNIILNAAKKGVPGMFFSLEMTSKALAERMLSGEGRVDSARMRYVNFENEHWRKLEESMSRLVDYPVFFNDNTTELSQVHSCARTWRRQYTKPTEQALIVIDYLQLIHADATRDRQANREREIAEISRRLKLLSKELQCPVLALSQLNRGLESRNDKRPVLSDLRESGAIEQDADLIAFLYRDEVYNPESKDVGIAEVIVAKHRSGPTAKLNFRWIPQICHFEELHA